MTKCSWALSAWAGAVPPQRQTDAANNQFRMVESVESMHRANVMAGVVDNLQYALFLAEHDRDLPQELTLARQEY